MTMAPTRMIARLQPMARRRRDWRSTGPEICVRIALLLDLVVPLGVERAVAHLLHLRHVPRTIPLLLRFGVLADLVGSAARQHQRGRGADGRPESASFAWHFSLLGQRSVWI